MRSGRISSMNWIVRFKETGVENVYMPMFIPESLLRERKGSCRGICTGSCMGHLWRTQSTYRRDFVSDRPLRLCSAISIRMRSSLTVTCQRYITSGALLSVGKRTTRPFLRSREFLWQEGHTAHATAEEAEAAYTADAEPLCRFL